MNSRLSNIELYYTPSSNQNGVILNVEGDEVHHILKVMRHKEGEEIFLTNGEGKIFRTEITSVSNLSVKTRIVEESSFNNKLMNIYFCVPKLKNPDRLEFALEKCAELGVTSFIIFDSERTQKKGIKKDRLRKILLSAMKQSLRSFLPKLEIKDSLIDISSLTGNKILFSQDAAYKFDNSKLNPEIDYYFIFGPEGDFTESEKSLFAEQQFYNLGENRLRSETAIIKCASLL